MDNPFSLAGKRILVTGASSGIGRQIAISCAAMGAQLVITGRDEGRLAETKADIGDAVVVAADLTITDQRNALADAAGLFDGVAIRAPLTVGSIADLTFVTARTTSVDEVNEILTEEAATTRYAGVLGVSRDPLVSSDIVGDARASVVDLELTKVIDGDLLKVMSWYDNEWGYANQMVREAVAMTARH